jgi:hypothetical protein
LVGGFKCGGHGYGSDHHSFYGYGYGYGFNYIDADDNDDYDYISYYDIGDGRVQNLIQDYY